MNRFSWVPLAFFWFIGEVLATNHGHYSLHHIVLFCALFTAYGIVGRKPTTLESHTGYYFVSGLFLLQLALRPGLTHATHPLVGLKSVIWLQFGLFAVFMTLQFFQKKTPGTYRLSKWIPWIIVLAALVAQAQVISVSPNPHIDVYTTTTEGSQELLAGRNPYQKNYSDIYRGAYDYTPHFAYLPGVLFWIAPIQLLGLDIRYALLLANVGIFVLMLFLSRGGKDRFSDASPIAMLWATFPVGLFVLEQAWIDTLLCFQILLFLVFVQRERMIVAGIVLGWFVATKQYAIFPAILGCSVLMKPGKTRAFMQLSIAAALTSTLCILPFVLQDSAAFYESTIGVFVNMPARLDAFTITAALKNELNSQLPSWIRLGIISVALVFCFFKSRSWGAWLHACVIFMTVFFLLGKQAFCNYYTLIAFMLLVEILWNVRSKKRDHHQPT